MTQQFSRVPVSGASVFHGPFYSWGVPGKPVTVRLPFELIDRLEELAVENFRSIDALGSEIGGLLFGGPDPGDPASVTLEGFEPIACDYSRGPFYRLSETDLAAFDAAIEKRGGPANARVAGFFRSHSRKGVALDAEDMKVIEERFAEPWQIVLLVRPFATKVSTGGIFIWEDGRMHGEASYREFPFRASELTAAGAAAPVESPRPARATVVPMPSRPVLTRPVSTPAVAPWEAPLPTANEPALAEPAAAGLSEPSEEAEPLPEPVVSEPATPPAPAKAPRVKALWVGIAAALLACSGALFLYPGLFRRAPRPPAALALRIERTATDLLLTWNRDSEAVRNASRAVLSISDGDRQENLDLNLADLRNGSIVYSPLSSDVSFRMEITGPDRTKTASESVRVLQSKPSPMPATAVSPAPPKPEPAPPSAAADEPKPETPVDNPAPGAKRPTPTFHVASLAERLRPALPTDLPEAPAAGSTPSVAGTVNLGLLAPAVTAIPRPTPPVQTAAPSNPAPQIRQPQLISGAPPVYPELARRQQVSGTVTVNVTIGADGKIASAEAVSGPELLRQAAVDAVKHWVYAPMTLNGRAVVAQKEIDVNFSLGR